MKSLLANEKNKKISASLLLLAGGRGRRMGGNKLFLSLDGLPVLDFFLGTVAEIFEDTIICAGPGEGKIVQGLVKNFPGVIVAEDRTTGMGPLEGLRQGLTAMNTEWSFLLGVDMLRASEAVIRQMWALTPEDADVSCLVENGRPNALHAFYKKSCLPHIDAALADEKKSARGGPKIISFYKYVTVRKIPPEELAHLPGWRRSFDNFNSPEELEGFTPTPL